MQTTLVTLGVVAVMAAIVGGGLKAAGVEIPVLGSIVRQALLGTFGLALIVVGLEPWQWLDPSERFEVAVPATQLWTDTAVDLEAGAELDINADGEIRDDVNNHPQRTFGPTGVPDPGDDHPGDPFKVLGFNHAALVGRIGEGGEVFEVGAGLTCAVRSPGRLFLGVNDGRFTDNDGQYRAEIVATSAASGSSSKPCSQR